MSENYNCDVLIIGSGPVGSTFARKIIDAGFSVIMVETGTQESKVQGEHKKNSIRYQKDLNSFVNVIRGDLESLSVPPVRGVFNNLNPTAWAQQSTEGGNNPDQDPAYTLDAKASRTVGGMATHWTCATPRPNKSIELPTIYDDAKWDRLFTEAEGLLRTSRTQFDNSLRQQVILQAINEEYAGTGRTAHALPLACKRRDDNTDYVEWSSAATILTHLTDKAPKYRLPSAGRGSELVDAPFRLLTENHCAKLLLGNTPGEIVGAQVQNMRTGSSEVFRAKYYVVAAGAVHTPQILKASLDTDEDTTWPKALGHFLTEQPMTFCQIVLRESLCMGEDGNIIFPLRDPEPQITMPFDNEKGAPWHTQIHRDAFSYGLVPEYYDQRAVVDLRFFGYSEPQKTNTVTFKSSGVKDAYGMPQPTFHYELTENDKHRADRMMNEMATALGGFLPGAEPQFLVPGAALHICGTYRAGTIDQYRNDEAVVDENCKVYGTNNLYLGGCGVISTGIACNPTLTAVAFAINSANNIISRLKEVHVLGY